MTQKTFCVIFYGLLTKKALTISTLNCVILLTEKLNMYSYNNIYSLFIPEISERQTRAKAGDAKLEV